MINIGIDIMGGDHAPLVVLEGCGRALPILDSETVLHLIGNAGIINEFLTDNPFPPEANYRVVAASETIEMSDHPVKAFQQKQDSSLNIGFNLLKKGEIVGLASAGNSGAIMVAALNTLGSIEGIDRPCAVSTFPNAGGGFNILLDVGINVDTRPQQFVQFAYLGAIYAQEVFGIEDPVVGLLNTGAEEGKGSVLYQKSYQLLKSLKDFTFVGNVEARDFYTSEADVIVCDGFTGNVFLKQTEGFYNLIQSFGLKNSFLEQLNYEKYGGTPILGLKGNVLLGHGISSAEAIKNMILATEKVSRVKLADKIEKTFIQRWQQKQL